jgi:hypothetical protein
MTAGDVLKTLKEGVEKVVGADVVSPTMYDEHRLDEKVSVYVFQENENGHLSKKFKITVETIS